MSPSVLQRVDPSRLASAFHLEFQLLPTAKVKVTPVLDAHGAAWVTIRGCLGVAGTVLLTLFVVCAALI